MAQPRDWRGRFASKSGTNKAKDGPSDRKGKEARKTRRKKKTAEEKRAAKASRLQKRLVFEAKVRRFNTTVQTVEGTVRTGTRLHKYAKDFSTVDWSGGLESKKARERSQQQIKDYRQRTIDRNKREAFQRKRDRERAAEIKRQQRERDAAKKEARDKTTGQLLSRQRPLPSGVKKTKKSPETTTRSMAEANRDFQAAKKSTAKKPKTKAKSTPKKKPPQNRKPTAKSTTVTTRGGRNEQRAARRPPGRPSPNSAKARGRSKRNIRRYRETGGTWSPNDLIG